MKQTFLMKLEEFVQCCIMRLSGHHYGCCDKFWKNCDKCQRERSQKIE